MKRCIVAALALAALPTVRTEVAKLSLESGATELMGMASG